MAALLLAAPAAWASNPTVYNGSFYADDASGTNHLTVSGSASAVTFHDDVASIDASYGCTTVDAHTVTCANPPSVQVRLGGGDDSYASTSPLPASVTGGAGDDVLQGGPANETLTGGDGADRISGGGGHDIANYDEHKVGANVTLGGGTPDGSPGEGDDVAGDVEEVKGSPYGDFIRGTDGPDTLNGWQGDDRLEGMGGDDDVFGGGGRDYVDGGPGNDYVGGGFPGYDADGQRDTVVCGPDLDFAWGHADDDIAADCEMAYDSNTRYPCDNPSAPRGKSPCPPPAATTKDPPTTTATQPPPLLSAALTVLARPEAAIKVKKGVAKIAVSCPDARVEGCAGTLAVTKFRGQAELDPDYDRGGSAAFAKGRFALGAGATAGVPVRLTRNARKLLLSKHKLDAVIVLDIPAGRTSWRVTFKGR